MWLCVSVLFISKEWVFVSSIFLCLYTDNENVVEHSVRTTFTYVVGIPSKTFGSYCAMVATVASIYCTLYNIIFFESICQMRLLLSPHTFHLITWKKHVQRIPFHHLFSIYESNNMVFVPFKQHRSEGFVVYRWQSLE